MKKQKKIALLSGFIKLMLCSAWMIILPYNLFSRIDQIKAIDSGFKIKDGLGLLFNFNTPLGIALSIIAIITMTLFFIAKFSSYLNGSKAIKKIVNNENPNHSIEKNKFFSFIIIGILQIAAVILLPTIIASFSSSLILSGVLFGLSSIIFSGFISLIFKDLVKISNLDENKKAGILLASDILIIAEGLIYIILEKIPSLKEEISPNLENIVCAPDNFILNTSNRIVNALDGPDQRDN